MTPRPTAEGAPRLEGPTLELLRRMARGDQSALGTLYDHWADRVHSLAYWILKDADEAEDVVEETFWQAWQSAGQYDNHRSAGSTWLMMICRSRAIDRLRSRRRRADWTAAPGTLHTLLETVGQQAESPDAVPEASERRLVLDSALRTLSAEQREALELAYFAGLSHSEIAGRTGQPLGTIKTRIRLAMQKLRDRLAYLAEEDR